MKTIEKSRNLSPEIDDKIAKIKERIFKNSPQKTLNFEKTRETSFEKNKTYILPQTTPFKFTETTNQMIGMPQLSIKNVSDIIIASPIKKIEFGENFEKSKKNQIFLKEKTNFEVLEKSKKIDFEDLELQKNKKNAVSPMRKPNNFKENIKKLKQIYHDKSFVNFNGNDDFKKVEKSKVLKFSPIATEKNVKDSAEKSENLQISMNFSESKNFSTPNSNKNSNPPIISHEKNRSLAKRIDFESELNYSVSQKEDFSAEKIEENDPVLKELRSEANQITEELEYSK